MHKKVEIMQYRQLRLHAKDFSEILFWGQSLEIVFYSSVNTFLQDSSDFALNERNLLYFNKWISRGQYFES